MQMPFFRDLLGYYAECIEIESLEQLSYGADKEEKSLIKFPGEYEWSSLQKPTLTIKALSSSAGSIN